MPFRKKRILLSGINQLYICKYLNWLEVSWSHLLSSQVLQVALTADSTFLTRFWVWQCVESVLKNKKTKTDLIENVATVTAVFGIEQIQLLQDGKLIATVKRKTSTKNVSKRKNRYISVLNIIKLFAGIWNRQYIQESHTRLIKTLRKPASDTRGQFGCVKLQPKILSSAK